MQTAFKADTLQASTASKLSLEKFQHLFMRLIFFSSSSRSLKGLRRKSMLVAAHISPLDVRVSPQDSPSSLSRRIPRQIEAQGVIDSTRPFIH